MQLIGWKLENQKPLPQEKYQSVEFLDETSGTNVPDQFIPGIKKVDFLHISITF